MANYGDIKVANRKMFVHGALEMKTGAGAIVSVPKWFLVDTHSPGSIADEDNLKKLKAAGGIPGPPGDPGRAGSGAPLMGSSGWRMKFPVKKPDGSSEDRYCDSRGRGKQSPAITYSVLGIDQL